MRKKIQLAIDDPCHESWDNMTQAEKGRFCASCQKQVIDFTSMTDREIAAFFKKPSTGSVCGRFMNDQLNRDLDFPRKRIPWLKYFFQVAIPAFFATTQVDAQEKQKPPTEQCVKGVFENKRITLGGISRVRPDQVKNKTAFIAGQVTDANGEPLPNVSITHSLTKEGAITNSDGHFMLMPIVGETKSSKIIASCIGFGTVEMEIVHSAKPAIADIKMSPVQNFLAGEVVVTGYVGNKFKRLKPPAIPVITQRIMDTAYKFFKLAPNPVPAGQEITIEWKQKEEGYYKLVMMDQAGKLIQQREVWIDAEAKLLNLDIPFVPAGIYILQVINKKSGKGYSEKLVVQ